MFITDYRVDPTSISSLWHLAKLDVYIATLCEDINDGRNKLS